jgi:hypothetical protein
MPSVTPIRGVLFVNGVAIAANQANYSTNGNVNSSSLAEMVVGANTRVINDDGTAGNPASSGVQNFFRGVLDELEMFVWGRGYDPATDTYTDFGTFNFATDNGYAASQLTGVPGDINSSGALNQADVDAFVAGWQFTKTVNGIRVGDLVTFAKGDLNFDGITNLTDMDLFRAALGSPGSGAGAGLDLSALDVLGIPEPATIVLSLLSIGVWGALRRSGTRLRASKKRLKTARTRVFASTLIHLFTNENATNETKRLSV